MGTALTGEIGYEEAAVLVKEAQPAARFAMWCAKSQEFRKNV
jgi:hypothetical protein